MHHHRHHHQGGGCSPQPPPGGAGYPQYPPQGGGGGYPSYPQPGGGYPPSGSGCGYPQAGYGRRDFFIVSEMNGKALDIRGGNASPGVDVIMYRKKSPPAKNQLWYTDQQGIIRSALNDLVFQNNTKGQPLKMTQFTGDPRGQWRVEGNKIVNRANECLDIRGANNGDGAELCAYDFKNQKNQHWRLEYI